MKKLLKKSMAFLAAVVMTFSSVLPNLTAYAASSVTYNRTIQDSHGTKTSIFQVDGIFAWCCEAEKTTPASGQAVTIAESTNENLRKVLWYGNKGPGAILSDDNDGYMQTSQAASLALGNGTVNSRYRAWYNEVITKSAPPSGFKAYIATPTNTSLQKLAYFVYTPEGSAYLQKSSSNASFSSGSGYSLNGATYGVYTDSACTNKIETLTTNASGTSNTITLDAGTYYVKETSAPEGFVLDTTVYTLTVVSGETAVLNVTDAPKGRLQLQKSSALPEITNGNNCYSLEGAVYGVYTDEACTNEVGRLTTDANGVTNEIILDTNTYYVKELVAPNGYKLSETKDPVSVSAGQVTTLQVTDQPGNDPIAIEITKVAPNGATHVPSLAGTQFTVKYYDGLYTKDNLPSTATRTWVIETKEVQGRYVTVLADSYKVSGDSFYKINNIVVIPIGTISIEETKPAPGYTLSGGFLQERDSSTKYTGKYVTQVTETSSGDVSLVGGNIFQGTNYLLYGGVAVQKYDSQTNTAQGSASLAGAKFTIKNANDYAVTVNGTSYNKGDLITTLTTDKNGYAATAKNLLPYGKYEVEEIEAPEGHQLSGTNLKQTVTVSEENTLVTAVTYDDVIRGGLELHKVDKDTEKNEAQAGASLKEAEFAITNKNAFPVYVNGKSYAKDEVIMVVKTDENGVAKTAENVLPYGTYEVSETKASEGYKVAGENLKQTVVIKNQNTIVTLKPVKEEIIRGDVAVQKYDSQTNAVPQGSATLKGAEFTIKSLNTNDLVVDGKTYKNGDIITTLVTNENGYAKTSLGLPYGKYEIEETKAPAGYLLAGTNLKQQFEIKEDGKLVELNSTDTVVKDNVIRGGIEIHKVDFDTEKDKAQAGASLKDAEFAIVNKNERPVYVNGKTYAKGETVMTIKTNEKGVAKTAANVLPYGTYEVAETKASEGYKVSGENLKQTVVIKNNTEIVTLKPVKEEIIRGDVAIQKYDSQTNEAFAQGAATLKGAEFTVKSLNANDLVVDGKTYKNGDVVTTIVTDEKGYAKTSVGLPYGKYEIEEVKVPEGYLLSGTNLKQQFEIKEDGKLVKLNTEDTVVKDDIIRGDFELRKIEHYSEEVMANVEFKITSKTTGESHVIVTDENGYYSSSAEYVLHSDEKGLWFGLDSEGNSVEVNDKLGALPYDTYEIEELRCDANMHTDLYKGEFTINENNKVVDLGVIENYARSIKTSAKDSETETNYATPDEEVVIIDTVYYEGLFVGEEYKLEGVLMDKVTGKAFLDKDGKEITASTVFKPEEREGYVDVTFKFDATLLAGKVAVVFETLFDAEGNIQAEHKDIDDTEQTVYFPEIKTSLKDKEDYQVIFAGPVELVDTITYKGLEAGKEYTVEGTLKDKETGKSVLDEDKNEIKATTTFVAKESDGTVDVVFKFDATLLAGKTLVAFEKLFFDGKEYAVHEDINDVAQTVYVPKVSTSAHDKKDNDKNVVIGGVATIVDKISYENLTVGEKYVVKGVLMDKNTEKPVLVDGKEITATKEFVAETANGFVEIEFSIDTDKLGAKTLVVFEEVYQLIEKEAELPETPDTEETVPEEPEKTYEERLIAEHKDITDKNQTVTFTESPKTGDMNVILPWIVVMGLAAAMIAFVMRRRFAR